MKPAKPPIVQPLRLTNVMRTTFVGAVMADVPEIDFEQQCRDAVNKAHAKALPAIIKKLLSQGDTAGWVRQAYVTIRGNDGLPDGHYISFQLHAPSDEWLEKLAVDTVAPICKQWSEQIERNNNLRLMLRRVSNTCTTTTALAEAFPEFARYLPLSDAEATRNLPALANMVSEFVKAGWPKQPAKAA